MSGYFLTPQAIKDLETIHDFIAEDSIKAARQFIDFLELKCESLAKAPTMGRSREELAPGLRSLPVKRYVIFYRQNRGHIEIIRILHGARDIVSFFPKNS